ncbi:MAG: hypothetical protein M0C28_31620 [Candidatus Moduliflexus flocculans]|nr:hypothetical protein [Candidatus Moduliflexus flocculans]
MSTEAYDRRHANSRAAARRTASGGAAQQATRRRRARHPRRSCWKALPPMLSRRYEQGHDRTCSELHGASRPSPTTCSPAGTMCRAPSSRPSWTSFPGNMPPTSWLQRTWRRLRGLYPVLVTSFRCSPDSFVVEYFKRLMDSKGKPYLILQLDEHRLECRLRNEHRGSHPIVSAPFPGERAPDARAPFANIVPGGGFQPARRSCSRTGII